MAIIVKQVSTRGERYSFIHLPARINRDYRNWVPPIYSDEWTFYHPVRNKAAEGCETVLFLACKGRKPVGRIMGIIHHRYNELHNEKNGRFFGFECYNDQEIAHALISRVERWAAERGMTGMVGPLGFSDKDPQGFQIEGFGHPPIYATACQQPYMIDLLTGEGYTKMVDLNDYIIDVPQEIPEIYQRVSRWTSNKFKYRLVEFKRRKEIRPYIISVFQLMNEAYQHILGFVPLDDLEMKQLADRYLPVLNPEYIKLVFVDDDLVGFIIAMPEMAPGIRRANGHLFPFGFLKILNEMKRTHRLTLLLGAIKKPYRGNGVDVLMGMRMLETCKKNGITQVESHLILENNLSMNGELTKLGAQLHKRFRIYTKSLERIITS